MIVFGNLMSDQGNTLPLVAIGTVGVATGAGGGVVSTQSWVIARGLANAAIRAMMKITTMKHVTIAVALRGLQTICRHRCKPSGSYIPFLQELPAPGNRNRK